MSKVETLSLGGAIKLDKEFSLGIDFDKIYDFGSLKCELVKEMKNKLEFDFQVVDPTLEKDIINLATFLRLVQKQQGNSLSGRSSLNSSGIKVIDIFTD